MYYVGLGQADITPPVGYLLQGHSARNQPSQMVHDPLYLKAMTISDGAVRVALITADLVYFSRELADAIKTEIARRCGLPPERVMLAGAHTHTGPFIFASQPGDQRLLPDYLSLLQKKAVGAVIEAVNREMPAALRWGSTTAHIGAVNRRRKDAAGRVQMAPNPQRPIDTQLTVFAACDPGGRPRALVCNYACHPTVLATNIYQISADYPGVLQRVLQQMYPGALAMFTNGCCGDVRPGIIDHETGHFKGGTFADTERIGHILAGAAITAFEQSVELAEGDVSGCLQKLALPVNEALLPTDAARLEAAYLVHQKSLTSHDGDDLEKWREYWKAQLAAGAPIPKNVPMDLQVLRIGPARILGIAAEVMVEIGLQIKAAAREMPLMVCGDANGVIGYLPTAEALSEGGYETNSFIHKFYAAPYAPTMEKTLVKTAVELINGC